MKVLFSIPAALGILAATLVGCENQPSSDNATNQTFYGSVIETQSAVSGTEVRKALAESGRTEITFEGTVTATCTKKGCWMDVASGEDTVFVQFLDYGFFVPTEGAVGKRTVIQGEAFFDTLTVPMLQHYAEDAGKSQEEIEAILEPELRLAFVATGVMIED